jgi:hypothetical protein
MKFRSANPAAAKGFFPFTAAARHSRSSLP